MGRDIAEPEKKGTFDMKLGALSVGFIVVGIALVGCGPGSKPTTPQCLLNSDCAKLSTPGLVCALGYCVKPCNISSDCPSGQRCIVLTAAGDAGTSTADAGVAQGTACQAPELAICNYNSMCTSPLVCSSDHQCRDMCETNADCPGMGMGAGAQVCTSTTHLCADPAVDKDYSAAINDFVVNDAGMGIPQGGNNGTGGSGTGQGGTSGGAGGRGGSGGAAGGSAGAAGGTAGTGGVGCGNDLSNIGTGDFTISLTLTTTAMNSTGPVSTSTFSDIGLTAIIAQWSSCNASAPAWSIRAGLPPTDAPANAFWIDMGTIGDTGVVDSTVNMVVLNDGVPHMVVVTRISGTMSISVDGVAGTAVPSTSNFGALPPLATGTDVCVGVDGTVPLVGTVTNVCISRYARTPSGTR
jgi:hypothetical protein